MKTKPFSSCHQAILLHRAKADLTLLDENKNTALHLACSKVHIQIIHNILRSMLWCCVMRILSMPVRENNSSTAPLRRFLMNLFELSL